VWTEVHSEQCEKSRHYACENGDRLFETRELSVVALRLSVWFGSIGWVAFFGKQPFRFIAADFSLAMVERQQYEVERTPK
jgi:hypothetical protein